MAFRDDDLDQLVAHGVPPLPVPSAEGRVHSAGADIWFADFGSGPPVVLLHPGMGNATHWSHIVPILLAEGYRVVALDSRGQGRSSNDGRPFSYRQMAEDTFAVLEHVGIARAAFVGWSDGADTALELARTHPDSVAGVFFFACNVDSSGGLPFEFTDRIGRVLALNRSDYEAQTPTDVGFDEVFEAVGQMQSTQPEYSREDLAGIAVPVTAVIGETDEFIRREHIEYLAESVPNARFVLLPEVGHFAPFQRPAEFAATVLDFLRRTPI